jgi:hypothetical protein
LTGSTVDRAVLAYYNKSRGQWMMVTIAPCGMIEMPIVDCDFSYAEFYELRGVNVLEGLKYHSKRTGSEFTIWDVITYLFSLFLWRLFFKECSMPVCRQGELFCADFVTGYLQTLPSIYEWFHSVVPEKTIPGGPNGIRTLSLQKLFLKSPDVTKVITSFDLGN